MSVGRTGDGSPEGELVLPHRLTEADVRRIAREETMRAIRDSLGGFGTVDRGGENIQCFPDGSDLGADHVRGITGALFNPGSLFREHGSGDVMDPIDLIDYSHESSPSVAGPVPNTPDDPATTVGDTTDIRSSADAGESAGAVIATAPALTDEVHTWWCRRADKPYYGITIDATEAELERLGGSR